MDKIHVCTNHINVFIHDIDVSITDVHVLIINIDISVLDSYVSISSIDVDVGCCDIRLLSLSLMSMFPSSKFNNLYRVPCMHEQGLRGVSCQMTVL